MTQTVEAYAAASPIELRLASWLTPLRRNVAWLAGLIAISAGYAVRPRAVEVQVHPRRDADRTYWQGTMAEPAVTDGSFFGQVLINGYESPPSPFPERTPPYRVSFFMHLRASESGAYHFELDSSWDGALEIDGQRVFGSGPFWPGRGRTGDLELAAGAHAATLFVQPAGDPGVGIRLLWKEPSGQLRPLTRRDLTIRGHPRFYALSERVAGPLMWGGAILFSLVTFFWLLRHGEKGSPRTVVLAAVLVGLLALLTRAAHFDTYPRVNMDETHNAWVGFNLIHEGTPSSWSWLPIYEKNWVSWFSYEYPLVEKAFDHPPLLPVLSGAAATLLGADNMFDCSLPRIRPLMVLAGTLSVVVLFLAACELTNLRTAFLAAVLMATSPLVVFNSRLVKEDCLVQLFLLLALYTYLRNRQAQGATLHWLTGAFCGLAALSKVMGLAVGFALSAVALVERPGGRAASARILGLSLTIASFYPLYGLLIDPDTYLRVVSHLWGPYSFESLADKFLILPRLILQPRISAVTPLIDGWILYGWVSIYLLFRHKTISTMLVAYLLLLMASLPSRLIWGFYIVPVLPLLCLAAAMHMRRSLMRQDLLSVFLFVGLSFLPSFATLGSTVVPGGFRGVLFVACLPLVPALLRLPRQHAARAASRWILVGMLLLGVLANVHRCVSTF